MKIKSLILVILVTVSVGQISLNAQQTDQKYAKDERKNDDGRRVERSHNHNEDGDRKGYRKHGKNKMLKSKNFRSNRRVAKADGKITREERCQMRREAKRSIRKVHHRSK